MTARIAELAAVAPVRHLDETGFRIAGKTQWLHTVSSQSLTVYRVSEKRGAVPEDLQGGVVVHDHFKPYYGLTGVAHAYCNAHHLRELKALIELDAEPWAKDMRDLLVEANDAVRKARQQGATALAQPALRRFVARYWKAVRAGLAFHRAMPALKQCATGRTKRRPGHNLLERLKTYKDDVLRFLHDFAVPFTNNLAEQDLRMMKVKMKISGGFRTFEGAARFASLRSVVSTARKRGVCSRPVELSRGPVFNGPLGMGHGEDCSTGSIFRKGNAWQTPFCQRRTRAGRWYPGSPRFVPRWQPEISPAPSFACWPVVGGWTADLPVSKGAERKKAARRRPSDVRIGSPHAAARARARYPAKPNPPKPTSSIAQVEGSGTAGPEALGPQSLHRGGWMNVVPVHEAVDVPAVLHPDCCPMPRPSACRL